MAVVRRRVARGVAVVAWVVLVAASAAGCSSGARAAPGTALWHGAAASGATSAAPPVEPSESAPSASAAPPGLRVIDYGPAPKGFPADATPMSTDALTEGLHPTTKIAVYDAPGGQPRAFLAPTISGVPITMPIVTRHAGWVAVLLPSVNRTVGWLPSGGWTTAALPGQLVLHRQTHALSWYRDGVLRQSWTVTIGTSATPTPLGRTFVLGRSKLPGTVYAGIDVLALGAVPDHPEAVAAGLVGAHTGIHSWYRDDFGGNKSNGCIRVPKAGQQLLLNEAVPGTPVVVLD